MFPDEVENQSIAIDQEMTQILGLANKDIKTVHITVFHAFKKLARDLKDTKKIQVRLLEMKTTWYEMKNTLDNINNRKDPVTEIVHSETEKIIF